MIKTSIRSAFNIMLTCLILSACSNQSVKGNNSGNSTNNPGENNTTQSDTLNPDGSSRITTSEQNDGNFTYLPGANNNPNDTQDITLTGLSNPNNLLSQRIIYFDYDKSAIRPEYMVLLNTHSKLLAKYPNLKMRLEGHADERGSREYNVALSAARSQSVKNIMVARGPSSKQMRTIGFGEEIPIVQGHNSSSWQQNRRVEIKYDDY